MNSTPANPVSRPLALIFLLLIAGAAALWLRSPAPRNVSRGAQLFLNTQQLEPTTTFEVRFDEPMVAPGNVGLESPPAPLVIQPSLPGKFVWLSQRSGVFTPTASPSLATRYTVRLRDGLQTAAGQPLKASLEQHFATPPFGCVGQPGYGVNPTNASATTSFRLVFNADVATNAMRSHIRYQDATGRSVPAAIAVGHKWSAHRSWEYSDEATPWADRFPRPQPGTGANADHADRNERSESIPAPNILSVSPARPLPAGMGWRLVVESGLPSADGRFRIAGTEEYPVGDVQPLRVTAISANNSLNFQREVRVCFNKQLQTELLGTNALEWFSVEPDVENLELRGHTYGGMNVSLAGSFELGTNYLITVRGGLPARDEFTLAQAVASNVVFEPLGPQVYLPTYTGEQLAGGRRAFEFLSLNCSQVHLTVKRLSAGHLIHALRGYRSYTHGEWSGTTPRALDYNTVAGITAFETTLRPERNADATVRHAFTWNELLGGRKHGAALIQVQQGAGDSPPRNGTVAQSLVQITDLGLLWKKTEGEILVWCFSYATGEPVPGATLRLASDESETLGTQTTDAAGFAKLPAVEKGGWLLAEKDTDIHAVEMSKGGLYFPWYQARIPWEYWAGDSNDEERTGAGQTGPLKALLFTERKVYRPGDTVLVKGILRRMRDAQPTLPEPIPLQLTCVDAADVECFRTNLTTSALGSLDAAIPLPAAPVGTYRIHLFATNVADFNTSFTVAEYEPNAFEVKVTAKPDFAAAEPVEIPVAASYYMGKALSNARLRWVADTADQAFRPAGLDDFTFAGGSYVRDDTPANGAMTLQGELVLDGSGKVTLTPDVPLNPRYPQPRRVELLVELTDANQQTVSTEVAFVRHASEFYLGAQLPSDVATAGTATPVTVIAVNTDGTPRPEPVPVKLTLKRIEYRTVRVEGAGKSVAFRNEREEILVAETNFFTVGLTNLGSKWDVAAGAAPAMIQPAEAGEHRLELRSQDATGHDVLTVLPLYVSGREPTSWSRRSDVRIELVPNQKAYQAGETARLLVKAPTSGTALVTIERERVLRHFQVDLQGNAPTLDIPLTDGDAPNVFVSVMMLRGADQNPRQSKLPDYRYGYCVLNVASRATTLDVSIKAARTDYQPGQTVDVAVQVADGFGAPAPKAEVTLYAVDEGVLSLTGYERPDPHRFFYAKQPLRVTTGLSIDQLEPENPGEVRFPNKGFVIGGGGRTATRKNFLACAFWSAALRTDAAGRVTAQFKAPDNLTRFRVIAVAHTAKQQFGSGESGFNINKPLMLEPALPRFANVGDEIVLRALVHNQSQRAGEVRVELALDEHAVLQTTHGSAAVPAAAGGTTPKPDESSTNASLNYLNPLRPGLPRSITLAPGASSYVEFPVRFTAAGAAKWTWRAKFVDPAAGDFTDAVESTLPVGYPQPLLRETHLARSDGGQLDLLADANPQLLEGRGTIQLRVANTRLVHLSEGVAHLLQYPYGCAEQTSSSLLPWVLLEDLPGVLPAGKTGGLNRNRALQLGFTRLLNMQESRGGLAYWPGGSEPMLWASAYGGFVLALADARGLPVPQNGLKRLLDYLADSLKGVEHLRDTEALGDRCLALLTLAVADRPQGSYHEVLFRKRDELSAESRAVLALAILRAEGPKDMAAELLDGKTTKRATDFGWFGGPERASAIRLAALCRLRPESPEIDKAVAELMQGQKAGRWATTQGNAWGLFALTEYGRLVEGAVGNSAASVSFNGEATAVTLSAERPVADLTFNLQPGTTPRLQLDKPGTNRLFTMVTLETRPALKNLPRQDRGFGITRRYELLRADGKLAGFKDAHVGDTVVITLTLDVPQAAHFVAVDDALPAVFEGINPAFKSQQSRAAGLAEDWFSDFLQIHADRVQFFRDHLPAGRYTITHSARVRAQGAVTAPGAKVEEMYHPERFGYSGTEQVTTRAAE